MSLASVSRMEAKLLLPTYERQPILFVRGRGVYLWDSHGKRYLDFLSGIGVNALGHNHPAVQATIKRQAGRLIHISNLFFHEYQAELAQELTRISGLDRAFFCNSGTEAWEGALKLARAFAQTKNRNRSKPKTRILAMENSFHGRTFGALATTGQLKYRAPFVPLMPGVTFVRFNDLDDLKRKFDSSVCAVCIETIQGEGGICPVNREFLDLASSLTKKSGALLVLDEIQCGLGRTDATLPTNTMACCPTWSPLPSRWLAVCRSAPSSPPNGLRVACIRACTGRLSAEDRWLALSPSNSCARRRNC